MNDDINLRKLCCAYLILFNKRRPMEVAEIKTETYLLEIKKDIADNEEIKRSLSAAENEMAGRL